MINILVIRSSANGERSVSNTLVNEVLEGFRAKDAGVSITDHDLDTAPIPHISAETLAGIGRPAPEMDAAKPTRILSDKLIAEVQAMDILVLGVPMYNFGISSTLKSWFDHVLRAGATFQYTPNGQEGLVKGKRAIIVASRAGVGSGVEDSHITHAKGLLGFIGITDVQIVLVDKLALGEESAKATMAMARDQIKAILA